MKNIILFIFFLTGISLTIAGENLYVDFSYPAVKGDFYISGKMSFPPGTVNSEDNICVIDINTKEEISSKITITDNWPDGSVLEAEILFPANTGKQRRYVISYGSDVKRRKKFSQTAVLPIISASIGKTPQTSETIDIPVGELLVKVDKSPDVRYYWYVVPMGLIIFLTLYRAVKNT
ncbi:MAG: hypothetical protein N3D17_07485 [bacterium]|nr:hypothetical protein [bacterium]